MQRIARPSSSTHIALVRLHEQARSTASPEVPSPSSQESDTGNSPAHINSSSYSPDLFAKWWAKADSALMPTLPSRSRRVQRKKITWVAFRRSSARLIDLYIKQSIAEDMNLNLRQWLCGLCQGLWLCAILRRPTASRSWIMAIFIINIISP